MPRIQVRQTKPKRIVTAHKIRSMAAARCSVKKYPTIQPPPERERAQGQDFTAFFNQSVPSTVGLGVTAAVGVFFLLVIISLANAPIPLATAALPSASSRTRLYVSETYGYKFHYPNTWVFEVNQVGKFEEVILSGNGEKIAVATTSEVSTSTLIPAVPETLVLNGISAFRYHDYDPFTGEPQNRVVIKRPDGLYHEILGYGLRFERLVKSFVLSNK